MPRTLPGRNESTLPNGVAPDSVLVARFQSGDEQALVVLFERYETPLFRFLIGLLRDAHQAEDALQETWCRALQRLDGVDADHLRAWLFTVAYHQAMLVKRRHKLRSCAALDTTPVPDPGPTPQRVLEQREELARLKELIDKLPAPQRDVILQRVYEGKRFRDIAEHMDCPVNTALARMHDGIQKLRLLWGQDHA